MKLSDYLISRLYSAGVRHVFLVVGGACSHIADSISRNPKVQHVVTQHEQAAGMAADAYTRLCSKGFGAALATSGPGATNLITGLASSWFDSIPSLFISGQVNLWETKGGKPVRQVGFQETDIVEIVRPLTKYAAMVKNPMRIRYELEKALAVAREGRPGPVWLDLPLNVQHAEVDPRRLSGFRIASRKIREGGIEEKVQEVVRRLQKAERPVILVGFGVRIAGAQEELSRLITTLGWPVVLTWSAADLVPCGQPLYLGRIGVYGTRGANFTVQNADFLLSLGSRLDTRQTGGQPQTFAREAYKVVVDIDSAELRKGWVKPDLMINADAKHFLVGILSKLAKSSIPDVSEWRERALRINRKYPAVMPEYRQERGGVNPYVFLEALSRELPKNAVVISDIGAHSAWVMQTLQIQKGQRFISAFGLGPMGYGLPGGIGAAFAVGKKRPVVCLVGDGGMQLNIQELQTIKAYRLPLKVFIFNNRSYGIIRQFQDTYFDGRHVASTQEGGYTCPDFSKIVEAYGLQAVSVSSHSRLRRTIREVLIKPGAVFCELQIPEEQKIIPKLAAEKIASGAYVSRPIEDQMPYLPRDEFRKNMIVEPIPEGEP